MLVLPQAGSVVVRATRAALMLAWVAAGGPARARNAAWRWGRVQRELEAGMRPAGFSEAEVRLAIGRSEC